MWKNFEVSIGAYNSYTSNSNQYAPLCFSHNIVMCSESQMVVLVQLTDHSDP